MLSLHGEVSFYLPLVDMLHGGTRARSIAEEGSETGKEKHRGKGRGVDMESACQEERGGMREKEGVAL